TVRSYDWDVIAYSSKIKIKDGYDYNVNGGSDIAPVQPNKLNHVIIWVQNRRFRVYHAGQKVLDMPTLIPENTTFNRLRFSLWSQDGHPYISNIRFTTASPDMRSKLLTEGKIVSHGIYFDSGSDKIKPESYGTLKEIAKVLTENPDVKIKIVGHTDSDGADDLNLELSKKRAASVKTALTNDFGIDASRMETDGMGESQPISGNNTPEEKANNRRVEFIKLSSGAFKRKKRSLLTALLLLFNFYGCGESDEEVQIKASDKVKEITGIQEEASSDFNMVKKYPLKSGIIKFERKILGETSKVVVYFDDYGTKERNESYNPEGNIEEIRFTDGEKMYVISYKYSDESVAYIV